MSASSTTGAAGRAGAPPPVAAAAVVLGMEAFQRVLEKLRRTSILTVGTANCDYYLNSLRVLKFQQPIHVPDALPKTTFASVFAPSRLRGSLRVNERPEEFQTPESLPLQTRRSYRHRWSKPA